MRYCWFALLALLLPLPTRAQPVLSENARISLVTIWPGDAVYSIYGHSALRVYDPALDLDASFNYGTFDFGNPASFVTRFAYGKLDYFLSVHDHARAVEYYWTVEGRPVVEQVLALSPGQQQALFRFLAINARPENKYYRYDFFLDNCSTRIRDALETVLGDSLQFAPPPGPDRSFRALIAPYAAERPFLDFAMNLGLGLPADRIATPRERMFLPLDLMAAFDRAVVTFDGASHPLVAQTDTLAWSEDRVARDPARPWPALLAWALFGMGLGLTVFDVRTRHPARRYVDGVLYGTAGVAGLLLVFLWFISLHTVTAWNVNLLWAWPTHVVAAAGLLRRSQGAWLRGYLVAAAAGTLVLVLGWPFWPQTIPGAVLPLALLLITRSAGHAWRLRSANAPSG